VKFFTKGSCRKKSANYSVIVAPKSEYVVRIWALLQAAALLVVIMGYLTWWDQQCDRKDDQKRDQNQKISDLKGRDRHKHNLRRKVWGVMGLVTLIAAAPVYGQSVPRTITTRDLGKIRALGDNFRVVNLENRTLRNLGDQLLLEGNNYKQQGNWRKAIEAWQNSLSYYRAVNDQAAMAQATGYIADAYNQLGSQGMAETNYQRQVSFGNTLGDQNARLHGLNSLSSLAAQKRDVTAAANYAIDAGAIAVAYGQELGLVEVINNSANIAALQGDNNLATQLYSAAISERTDNRNLVGEGYAYLNRGNLHMARADYRSALPDYRNAQTIGRKTRNLQLEAAATDRLIAAWLEVPNYKAIEVLLQQRTGLALGQQDLGTASLAQQYLGDLYASRGNPEKARYAYEQAYDLALQTKDTDAMREIYHKLQSLIAR